MLYLGHFSFDEERDDGGPWHAMFTCVVEANTVKAAVKKFERLIRRLARRHDVFGGAAEIYLDACVELPRVPGGGVMSYITLREGEDIGGISAALLGSRPKEGLSYAWGDEADRDSPEPVEAEPFIRFRRKKGHRAAETATARPKPKGATFKGTVH